MKACEPALFNIVLSIPDNEKKPLIRKQTNAPSCVTCIEFYYLRVRVELVTASQPQIILCYVIFCAGIQDSVSSYYVLCPL